MLASLMAAMKVPDLKKRITFLFGMLIVYVIGLHIPVPGVDTEVLRQRLSTGSDLLALFDVFTGGAFKKYAIFAMGIMPYINASIIMQLLTMAVPQLEAMQKEWGCGPEADQTLHQVAHRRSGVLLRFRRHQVAPERRRREPGSGRYEHRVHVPHLGCGYRFPHVDG